MARWRAAKLGVHSSSDGLDFSRSESFGHVGEAFVAQFGDMAPGAGKVWRSVPPWWKLSISWRTLCLKTPSWILILTWVSSECGHTYLWS